MTVPTDPARRELTRQRIAIGTAVLGVLVAAGFAIATLTADDGASTTPPAAAPVTSPSPSPSPSAEPAPAPTPEPSPTQEVATSDFGFLRGFGQRDGQTTVSLDRATLLTGDEAEAEAVRRGLEVPVPNDYLITNDNDRLREYPISPDVEVVLSASYAGTEPDDPVTSTLAELQRLFAELPSAGDVPFDLELVDGVIVSIAERYLP